MLGNIKCSCIFPHKIIWLKCSSELWWNKQAQFSCCWIKKKILLCFSPLPCTHSFSRSHWPRSTLPFHCISLNVDFQPQSNATCMTQDKMSPNFGNFLSSGEHLPPGTHTTKSQRVWSVSCVSTVVYFRMSQWPIYFSISSCFPLFGTSTIHNVFPGLCALPLNSSSDSTLQLRNRARSAPYSLFRSLTRFSPSTLFTSRTATYWQEGSRTKVQGSHA